MRRGSGPLEAAVAQDDVHYEPRRNRYAIRLWNRPKHPRWVRPHIAYVRNGRLAFVKILWEEYMQLMSRKRIRDGTSIPKTDLLFSDLL